MKQKDQARRHTAAVRNPALCRVRTGPLRPVAGFACQAAVRLPGSHWNRSHWHPGCRFAAWRLPGLLLILPLILLLAGSGSACGLAGPDNISATDKPATPAATSLTATSAISVTSAAAPQTLHILQNKVEVADVFRRMAAAYTAENPSVRLEIETIGAGKDYLSSLVVRFESGDAPDIFTNDGYALFDAWVDRAADLSDEPWVADMVAGAGDPVLRDGRLYGMPEAIEGFGFAYNKQLFARAGIRQPPDTLASLAEACQRLQAAGIRPFANGYAEWWVLGNHNLSIPLAHQADIGAFLADICTGRHSFADGTDVQGWIQLLDLTLAYGQDDPTQNGDYATILADFSSGEAAMIQQGNWIQPLLEKANPDLDVGFLPIPISQTPDPNIPVGVPNFWIVSRSSPREQAARSWLNWLVSSPTGQAYITDQLKYVPAFTNIRTDHQTGLNAALAAAIAAGHTYPWQFPRLPTGASVEIAHAMRQYLQGNLPAPGLFQAIDAAIIAASQRAGS